MRKILFAVMGLAIMAGPAYAQSHATCTSATVECGLAITRATADEYPHLRDDGMNGAAMEELLRRIIWHLQLNGIEAARQQNPSGRVSTDKLAARIDGQWQAYDVLSDRADPGPFAVQFNFIPGVNPRADWPLGPLADEGSQPPPPQPPSGGNNILDAIRQHEADEAVRYEADKARLEALLAEVIAARQSLEEHRAEARNTRNRVFAFLGNWRNWVKIGSAVVGTLVATGDMPGMGGDTKP